MPSAFPGEAFLQVVLEYRPVTEVPRDSPTSLQTAYGGIPGGFLQEIVEILEPMNTFSIFSIKLY